MRQIVLDTSTTGIEPEQGHRVVEIAALELVDGKRTGQVFHRYLNPDRELEREFIQTTGLTTEFLWAQPRFYEVASSLLDFVRGAELLIHNAAVDVTFIEAELLRVESTSLRASAASIVDTMTMARELHPDQRPSLDELCTHYGVNFDTSALTGALADAGRLTDVYIAGFAALRLERPKALANTSLIWTPDLELELVSYLRTHPSALFDLTPRRFEELIAAIFRNAGFVVELTPQTCDGGVDIIAVQHSAFTGDSVHLIECKRYHPLRAVGIGVVQRLLGTVTQHKATKGIVVTTSSFSRDAIKVAEATRHLIALNDFRAIVSWLNDMNRIRSPLETGDSR